MKKLLIRTLCPAAVLLLLALPQTAVRAAPAPTGQPARISTAKRTPAPEPLKIEARQQFYTIRIYRLQTKDQENRVDSFLQYALIPALHRLEITHIGVFKPIANDTAAIRRIIVFIPLNSLARYNTLPASLEGDSRFLADGRSYLDAPYNDPPYLRMESILLRAFPDMPRYAAPWTGQPYSADRIYELRSYESPTEKLFQNKVRMFNQGGEIPIFTRLDFHAVFYAAVLAGSRMPNLMYLTSYDNMTARDQHWKAFSDDPAWKKLTAAPEYQHNVTHIDDTFMHATPYSEL